MNLGQKDDNASDSQFCPMSNLVWIEVRSEMKLQTSDPSIASVPILCDLSNQVWTRLHTENAGGSARRAGSHVFVCVVYRLDVRFALRPATLRSPIARRHSLKISEDQNCPRGRVALGNFMPLPSLHGDLWGLGLLEI